VAKSNRRVSGESDQRGKLDREAFVGLPGNKLRNVIAEPISSLTMARSGAGQEEPGGALGGTRLAEKRDSFSSQQGAHFAPS